MKLTFTYSITLLEFIKYDSFLTCPTIEKHNDVTMIIIIKTENDVA